jgi:hypothetical protein
MRLKNILSNVDKYTMQIWYKDLDSEAKGVFDLIIKYHNYFCSQDKKFGRIVRFLKILILSLAMASTIILGLKDTIDINYQIILGLIISSLITFTTAVSSYFNYEEYWMRNVVIHIELNIIRDNFILDALAGRLDKEKIFQYSAELERVQRKNIEYWKKTIKKN